MLSKTQHVNHICLQKEGDISRYFYTLSVTYFISQKNDFLPGVRRNQLQIISNVILRLNLQI